MGFFIGVLSLALPAIAQTEIDEDPGRNCIVGSSDYPSYGEEPFGGTNRRYRLPTAHGSPAPRFGLSSEASDLDESPRIGMSDDTRPQGRGSAPESEASEVTDLLLAWQQGDQAAGERLMPLIYNELRRIARACFASDSPDPTVQPTDVVHDAYFRLVDQKRGQWQNREHFYALAARMIRRILVDHARRRSSRKRGGGWARIALEEFGGARTLERPEELMALDDALDLLKESDALGASLVELRFFGGLKAEEIAEVLHISVARVHRRWRLARARLYRELRSEGSRPAP